MMAVPLLHWNVQTEKLVRNRDFLSEEQATHIVSTFEIQSPHYVTLNVVLTPFQSPWNTKQTHFNLIGSCRPCCTRVDVTSARAEAAKRCQQLSVALNQTGIWEPDGTDLLFQRPLPNDAGCHSTDNRRLQPTYTPTEMRGTFRSHERSVLHELPAASPIAPERTITLVGSSTAVQSTNGGSLPLDSPPIARSRRANADDRTFIKLFMSAVHRVGKGTLGLELNSKLSAQRACRDGNPVSPSDVAKDLWEHAESLSYTSGWYYRFCMGCLLVLHSRCTAGLRMSKWNRHVWRRTTQFTNTLVRSVSSELGRACLLVHRVLAGTSLHLWKDFLLIIVERIRTYRRTLGDSMSCMCGPRKAY